MSRPSFWLMLPCCVAASPRYTRLHSAWTRFSELLLCRNRWKGCSIERGFTVDYPWYDVLVCDHSWRSADTHEASGSFRPVWVRVNIPLLQELKFREQVKTEHSSDSLIMTLPRGCSLSSSMSMLFYQICSKHALRPRFDKCPPTDTVLLEHFV